MFFPPSQVLLVVLVVQGVTSYKDPAACPRTIKLMLVKACGEAKRHVDHLGLPVYQIMSKEEIDRRYDEMVEKNMIKGVKKEWTPHVDDNTIDGAHPLDDLYFRKKRQLMDVNRDHFLRDPQPFNGHGKIYTLPESPGRQDRSPPPGALKAKCCGGYLCTMDDYRGFCH